MQFGSDRSFRSKGVASGNESASSKNCPSSVHSFGNKRMFIAFTLQFKFPKKRMNFQIIKKTSPNFSVTYGIVRFKSFKHYLIITL